MRELISNSTFVCIWNFYHIFFKKNKYTDFLYVINDQGFKLKI